MRRTWLAALVPLTAGVLHAQQVFECVVKKDRDKPRVKWVGFRCFEDRTVGIDYPHGRVPLDLDPVRLHLEFVSCPSGREQCRDHGAGSVVPNPKGTPPRFVGVSIPRWDGR